MPTVPRDGRTVRCRIVALEQSGHDGFAALRAELSEGSERDRLAAELVTACKRTSSGTRVLTASEDDGVAVLVRR